MREHVTKNYETDKAKQIQKNYKFTCLRISAFLNIIGRIQTHKYKYNICKLYNECLSLSGIELGPHQLRS